MSFCTACGHANPDPGRFCGQCGAPVAATGPAPAETTLGGPAIGPGQAGTPSPDAPTVVGHTPPFPIPGTTPAPGGPPTPAGGPVPGGPLGPGTAAGSGPLAVGQAFGPRYHIIRLLGVGGMGAVYQAWDAELGVAVALKIIKPELASDDPDGAREVERRFKRELVLARQVTHKNVVRIHDFGERDGIKYLSMPYVEGADLSHVLADAGKLPVPKALAIAKQVAAGLTAAHEVGVVHRDLKPANVMIDEDRALIMDFGIARSIEPGATMATVAGSVVGTVEYMAPEQARGEAVDQRADVYAFGLIVYDMLFGARRSASATNPVAELMRRMQEPLPAPRSIDPAIPEALDAIVTRCMQPDPAARFQTSAELLAALDALGPDGEPVAPVPRKRASLPVMAAAAAAVVALATGGWWLGQRTGGPAELVAHEPVSVLVADFDNKTGDEVFEGSLEQALTLGIEGAAFITSYSRQTAARLAEQIAPGAGLTEANARLVSVREGIKVILAGSIEPSGSGYRIEVNAVDPAVGETLATADATARDKAAVLGAVGSLATEIRKGLGDTQTESARLAAKETFTAGSLEAARAYSLAQDLASAGQNEQAIDQYRKAIERDPNFGRAYAGWAVSAYRLGRRDEAEDLWNKAIGLMERMTEREKFRTLGSYYLGIARNYDQAIDNYRQLLERYPFDGSGLNNLAVAYFLTLDFSDALTQGRRAVDVYPKNALYRTNSALYAMYAGDFATASTEARKVIEESASSYKAYLALAMADLAGSKPEEARQAYERMATAGASGASLSAMGLADLAMYEGRFADAQSILEQALVADEAADLRRPKAVKQMALAEVLAATGKRSAAVSAVRAALDIDRPDGVVVPAARLLLRAGREQEARALAQGLEAQLQKQSRAYAKLIEAEIALEHGRHVDAVDALTAARDLADLWLVRFALGRAYVEAEHYAEAMAELEGCLKRRGEATAVFLDDVPSYRYLVPVSYWLARAQEGLGLTGDATANYEAYLALRGDVAGDALAADARKRADGLR